VALDPSRQWLAAGITGLARYREWDAVVTASAPGSAGDEIELVALADGVFLVERKTTDVDPQPLLAALAGVVEPPYRALGIRRPELWVVGAVGLEVVALGDDLRGSEIEVVRDEAGVRVRIDGLPAPEQVPELEGLGEARGGSYVVRARRLKGTLFEVEVEAL
jgi:hypothetical protein